MQSFLGIACLVMVLATPTMVEGSSRTLSMLVTANANSQVIGGGSATVTATGFASVENQYRQAYTAVIASAFNQLDQTGSNAASIATASGKALGEATARVFVSTRVQIETSGGGSGCGSASAEGRAQSEASASAFASAFAQIARAFEVEVEASSLASAFGTAFGNVFASAAATACAGNGGAVTAEADALAVATARVFARVFALAFAAKFNNVGIANAVSQSEVDFPSLTFTSSRSGVKVSGDAKGAAISGASANTSNSG